MDVKDFLSHYGVKGMRWGKRNKRSAAKTSSDFRKSRELLERENSPSSLSNKQLKSLNERLNLEQNYSKMTTKKGKILSGKAKAEIIVGTIGVGVTAFNYWNGPAGKAARDLGRTIIKGPVGKHFKK